MIDSKKEDALIDQEILRLLQSKLLALKAIKKEEPPAGKDDGGRGHLMKPLTQVVDIRFRDPVTGAITKEHVDKVLTDLGIAMQAVTDSLPPITVKITPIIPMDAWDKMAIAFEENRADLIHASSNIVQDQADSLLRAEVDSYSARIDAARNYYNEQIALAGDNERLKSELRIKEERTILKLEKQRADREKKAALGGILVNTALGIAKAFATSRNVYDGIIQAAIVAATGASQYAIASRARYYAKGEIDIKGPGTKTSDSIPAMLSRGESIMTADETTSSKGVLKAVRARKLNDKMLHEIMSGRSGGAKAEGFNDTNIIKKLDELKNAQPDLLQRANLAYEIRNKGDKYKQIIRSKSIRS